MKKITLTLTLLGVFSLLHAQRSVPDSLLWSFHSQLSLFPQEKLHLHIDKSYYLSGEKIWFRAYLVDATTHKPTTDSRFVYIELINPLDSVITRVKINEEAGTYHGRLPIPDDIPQGNYTLRAYTMFMRSLGEEYFFSKTIHIGVPQARFVHTDTRFFFDSDRRIHATFTFFDAATSDPFIPQSVKVSVNEGRWMELKTEPNGTATVNFSLSATSRQRTMLLEVTADKYPFRQFIKIPTPDNDFDVSFYPEGGTLLTGTACKVAFKAMKSGGQSAEITGAIYSQSGDEVGTFKSEHLGMGSFMLLAEKEKSYYVICQNDKGQSKRFNLPVATDFGYALAVSQVRENIHVSVLQPSDATCPEALFLLAHTDGMVHFINPINPQNSVAVVPKELFPSGVLHLILFDAGLHPVSERLVFIRNQDQANVSYSSDKENYAKRSLVQNNVTITDYSGQPLHGNFSVAVTSDREVTPDTTSNIMTHLLLTSDLRGHIENPAFYFQNTSSATYALDLLMCTQGWRRYNVSELAQGRFTTPSFPLEAGSEISGTVRSMLTDKPVEGMEVTAAALTHTNSFFGSAQTDKSGRFYLSTAQFPDSTWYMVSVEPKRRMTRMNLVLDPETFPARTISSIPPVYVDRDQFAQYAEKAEQQYLNDGGIRATLLSPAVVTAQHTAPPKSQYYTEASNSLTEEWIERFHINDIAGLLQLVPGLRVQRDPLNPFGSISVIIQSINTIRGGSAPLLLVNNVVTDMFWLDKIDVKRISRIDVLKGADASVFGMRGSGGVISIFTNDLDQSKLIESTPFHIRSILSLGHQQPVEFYAPRYDTSKEYNATTPDLRTTVHWQPVVQTDSQGVASFEFYAADESTFYTVIIEGVADNGQIIRQEAKLRRSDEDSKVAY